MKTCWVCGKPIDDGEKYSVVWDLPKVGFAHLKCSDQPEFIDITDEIKGFDSHEEAQA